MITFVPPRLRKPAMYGLAGMLFAAAWLIRGGPLWWGWWPFLVTLIITGYGYLLGLGNFGIAEEGTPDDEDTAPAPHHPVRS